MLDLLTACNDELQRHVLKCISRMVGSSNEALRLWTSGRLFSLLQLTTKLTTDVTPLLGILRMMVPSFIADDVDVLFEWLLAPTTPADTSLPTPALTSTLRPGLPVPTATSSQSFGLGMKAKVLELFYEEFRQKPHLEQYLRVGSGGFLVLLALLEIPIETVRILALKMLGLLLYNNPKNAAQFRRVNGFEQLFNLLSRFPPTYTTCSTLLSLAVDAFGWAPAPIQLEGKKSWIPLWRSGSSPALPPSPAKPDKPADPSTTTPPTTTPSTPTTTTPGTPAPTTPTPSPTATPSPSNTTTKVLTYPEIMHVVLLLLQSTEKIDLRTQVLGEMERLLVPSNMEILWGFPWLEWLWEFVVPHPSPPLTSSPSLPTPPPSPSTSTTSTSEMKANTSDRTHGLVLFIAQKMMLYDISKKSNRMNLEKMPLDMEGFYEQVLLTVIDHFEKFPCLPTSEAGDIVKNMNSLYKSTQEDMGLPVDLAFKILTNITTLTFHNTPAIRGIMKSSGLLDLRDTLVIHLLRSESARAEFVCNYAFECVADHKQFREKGGIIYLFNLFQHSHTDPQLQATIYGILRNVMAPIEANKAIICTVLEDSDTIDAFLRDAPPKGEHTSLSASTSSLPPPPPVLVLSSNLSVSTSSLPTSHSSPSVSVTATEGGWSGGAGGSGSGHFPQMSFLEWYYMDERKTRRDEIEARIATRLATIEAKTVEKQDKLIKTKGTRQQSLKKTLQKAGGSLARSLGENEEKRRARVAKGVGFHVARMKDASVGREERTVKGSEGWRAFLGKDAVNSSTPSTTTNPTGASSISSIPPNQPQQASIKTSSSSGTNTPVVDNTSMVE